jgi:glycolate oxidase
MINRIVKLVGEENYSEEPIDLIAYSTDASMIEGKVQAVVWPRDVEEIRKIVSLANQLNLNIVPRGAGTGLAGGAVPEKSVVIDLSRMAEMKVSTKESYAILGPGVVVDTLNKALLPHGLFFPVIPSSSSVATIGGMIATNAAGNRAIKYGRMIDWLLELEVVDGAGRVYDLKNGFDKFCGTEGTIGIVTRAKVKLTKPISETSLSVYKADSPEAALEQLASVKSQADIIAIELLDKLTSRMAGYEERFHLFCEHEGMGGHIQDQVQIDRWWKLREGAWPVVSSNGYIILEDPQADDLLPLMKWLDSNNVPYFGHVGLGIIHPAFKPDQREKITEMHKLVQEIGGNVTGEHGIGRSKKDFVKKEFADRIRELKSKYDPKDILNRGKVI